MLFDPYKNMVGGFSPNDGTIGFYLRVNSIVENTSVVLDLGAGRGAWFSDDPCETRRNTRLLKGKVREVIAADVDAAVRDNLASDRQIVIENGELDLPKASVDVIVADYVFEHVAEVVEFAEQANHVLKEGGWLCARTPHKFNYVALIAAITKNNLHSKVLEKVQPNRKEIDVFPTVYKLNTIGDIRRAFPGWSDHSFVHRSDPAYFFGNRFVYAGLSLIHRLFFKEFSGSIFVFLRKGSED